MKFCSNCGNKINIEDKFCSNCASPIKETKGHNTRENLFDGKIFKCSNCGEVLNSFSANCPTCGYELRGSESVDSLKEFSNKLEQVKNNEQKISIIRNFPIPNTKEDIFEFLILASSNIDENLNKEVFNAWGSKIEQCYEKAKLSFNQDRDFVKIQAIYEKTHKSIKKIRIKGPMNKVLKIVSPILLFILLNVIFWSWISSGYNNEAEEITRLEAIVVEIENALSEEEYDLAMMHAKSIDYSAWTANNELERQWDIKRDYLIKKIIKEAEKDGIVLEYPTDTADEKDRDKTDNISYDDYEEIIEKNVNEFKENMKEAEETYKQIMEADD